MSGDYLAPAWHLPVIRLADARFFFVPPHKNAPLIVYLLGPTTFSVKIGILHKMTRKRDYLDKPDIILHVFNQGARQGSLFHNDEGYEQFLELLAETRREFPVSLLVHCLVPTRFDIILHQHEPLAVADFVKQVCQTYSRWLNEQLGKKGTNYQGRYGGAPVFDPETFMRLAYHILRTPVNMGLAPSLDAWPYTSYNKCLNETMASSNGQALILKLTGGPEGYERFMKQFKAADPDSVKQFLSPDCAAAWAEKGLDWLSQGRMHRSSSGWEKAHNL